MMIKILRIAQSAVIFAAIYMQTGTVEADNDAIVFFEEMDTVMISPRTAELVIFLESLVFLMARGDRSIKRYFESYSTPFQEYKEFKNKVVNNKAFNNKPSPRSILY